MAFTFNWYQNYKIFSFDIKITKCLQLVSWFTIYIYISIGIKIYNVSFSLVSKVYKIFSINIFWYVKIFCLFSIGIIIWYQMFWYVSLLFVLYKKGEKIFYAPLLIFVVWQKGGEIFFEFIFYPFVDELTKKGEKYLSLYMHGLKLSFIEAPP